MRKTTDMAKVATVADPTELVSVEFDGNVVTSRIQEGGEFDLMEKARKKMRERRIAQTMVDGRREEEPPTTNDTDNAAALALEFAAMIEPGSATFRQSASMAIYTGSHADLVGPFVHAVEPKDAVEVLLASQMGAVHMATMSMVNKLSNAEYLEQAKFYEGALNRLARTYAGQVEALRKHRTGGTQTVRHVHVNEGGQAIVADTINHMKKEGGDGE